MRCERVKSTRCRARAVEVKVGLSSAYNAVVIDRAAQTIVAPTLTERVIVLCVYAAHACSFNYKSDYNNNWLGLDLIW